MIKGRKTNRIRDHPKDERSSFYEKMVDYLKKALIYGHTSRISS